MGVDDIINVSEDSFEQDVLAYSQETPVYVLFWANWSPDSTVMIENVRQITLRNQGEWRIALVDVDSSKQLSKQMRVTNVPAIRVFIQREQVGGFTGTRPKEFLVEFFDEYAPSSADLLINKGHHLMVTGDWEGALEAYDELLEAKPKHPQALLNKIRCLIALGRGEEAINSLQSFPVSPEFKLAQELFGIAVALSKYNTGQISTEESLGSIYNRSLMLITKGNLPAALDGMMAVLREDKSYLNGEVKNVIIGLLNVIRVDEKLFREYQKELASILF